MHAHTDQEQREVRLWKAVDMWGAGVLLAQMLAPAGAAAPLFNGYSANLLLGSVFAVRECRPAPELLAARNSAALNHVAARVPADEVRPLSALLPAAPAPALDLVRVFICVRVYVLIMHAAEQAAEL